MNFEKETIETTSTTNQPIIIMVLILALSAAAFYYFNQQIKESINTMLNGSEISFEISPEPKIDFEFLKSEEFANLESFPDYPSFKENEKIEIAIGRNNPFVPFSGYVVESPQEEVVQEVKENPTVENPNPTTPTEPAQ
jgi:hypothetical protein